MTKEQKRQYEEPEVLREILKRMLAGKKFRLDCGHHVSFGHFLGNNITIYNAASSEKSLGIMLLFAAIGTPLVLSYTAFVFYTFRGKVRLDETSY